jgi:UDP-3-O-[3-hydroxymyristoyl] glucosamine N-acyltransferase
MLSPDEAQAQVRAVFGDSVTVKPVKPVEDDKDYDADFVDTITRICYFYPQYTLDTAQKLTQAQANALLIQAERQRALEYYNQTLIAAAPHTKKGKMVEKLLKEYKRITES